MLSYNVNRLKHLVVHLPISHRQKIEREHANAGTVVIETTVGNVSTSQMQFGNLMLVVVDTLDDYMTLQDHFVNSNRRRGAFLTGSLRYGNYRTPNSDIDIVIRANRDEVATLRQRASTVYDHHSDRYGDCSRALSMRFDNLNIIAAFDRTAYDGWQQATLRAQRACPSSKRETLQIFNRTFSEYGLV